MAQRSNFSKNGYKPRIIDLFSKTFTVSNLGYQTLNIAKNIGIAIIFLPLCYYIFSLDDIKQRTSSNTTQMAAGGKQPQPSRNFPLKEAPVKGE